jgi:hypothetical protein
MGMARGGGFSNKLAVEPEVEAALVEAAPSKADIEARRAQAQARVAGAEEAFKLQLREQIEQNMERNGVDASLVDLSDKAMDYRIAGLRKLLKQGYKVNEIQREVLYSGKSKLFVVENDEEKLLGFERTDGQLLEVTDMAAELL